MYFQDFFLTVDKIQIFQRIQFNNLNALKLEHFLI